jgi:hypothetical protein
MERSLRMDPWADRLWVGLRIVSYGCFDSGGVETFAVCYPNVSHMPTASMKSTSSNYQPLQ